MSAAKKIIAGGTLLFLFFHSRFNKKAIQHSKRETFSLIQQLHAGGELARALVH
jgi:hypothetical protein